MNRKIFIADDDKNLIELYKGIFVSTDEFDFFSDSESESFDIETFDDGEYLIERVKNFKPNESLPVAILDMRMRKLNGFETAKKLRELDKDIYIVIITAYSDMGAREIREYLQENIYFLKKPFNEDELYSLIHSLILNWNQNRELRILNTKLEERVQEVVLEIQEKNSILMQQSRQAALGEMIGNIAHQWRQPLSALALSIQDLLDAYEYQEITKDYIENLVKESMNIINYMSETIDNFRNFFKPDNIKENFNPKDEIEKAIYLIKSSLDINHIKLDFKYDSDVNIFGYKNEFSQVILNLLKNSQDILIEKEIKEPHIKLILEKNVDNIKVIVEDNGGGIANDIIQKIFDPYFTTKHQAIGTGLGLYMSKTIIEKHMGGSISVLNIAGGVQFTLEFSIL